MPEHLRRAILGTAMAGLACCSKAPECGGTCPQATAKLELTGGTVIIGSVAGTESTLVMVPETEKRVASGTCVLTRSTSDVLPDNTVNGFLYLICNPATYEMGTFIFAGSIVDPRALRLSDTIQFATAWGSCAAGDPNNLGTFATLTVTEAVGGIAPYPTMVTPDYRRVYSVDLDTGPADCSNGSVPAGCPICSKVGRMQVHLALEQTAADFQYMENGPCMCE